ncbi:MAG: dTDP-4-dehydrorhamnose 3,5-epimerase [Candidatus Wallbacteria bacterium HGW-Wallbacteria-1]|uniref:dTDP-4-dehydrorhamnose 3,5-epimerase n=1 Tax=Candidatus Wallbacteria bacterium HGW-Wallbacteria-1 TaxID=2013854 RepID=A0A2N1PMM9_9BACT|nr:MAG: dTDP-4-dehydrorhamnose 3,5-epimerase [Candidatus Wallbacteria bacterium HGW-Wallbacteria-1]
MNFETNIDGIEGLSLFTPRVHTDSRGCFHELFRQSQFSDNGIQANFQQDNISVSRKGVVRGLHFQTTPFEQAKLVICIVGEIYDVALDLRIGSPTLGRFCAMKLNASNPCALYIPRGFAHGFQCLSESATLLYKCDTEYSPDHESGIFWQDPELKIPWPINDTKPILSERDLNLPMMSSYLSSRSNA